MDELSMTNLSSSAASSRQKDGDLLDILRKQELVRAETAKESLRQQQTLQNQIEELQLQRQLLQLQEMKEAAVREAMMAGDYGQLRH